MYRRLQLILVTFLSIYVSLSIAPGRQAKATAQAGSAILSFANLSDENSSFDVYLAGGSVQPIVTNSRPQTIGGVVELPAGEWTVNLLKAGSAADSPPVFSQKLTLSAGEHIDLIAIGSLNGKDTDAFALKQVTLNYEAIPENTTRVGVLDLLPDAPEVNIRFGTKFIVSHIKYGDFKEVDGSWSPNQIQMYASPQETILPDEQNYGKISSFTFDTSAYHLLVIYGNKSDPHFVELHTPTKYSFVRFVNAAQGSPVTDFSEGPDHFGAMQNIAFSKASYWIPLPGGMTTYFRAATHDPQPTYFVSLGSIDNAKLEAGGSYLVLTFGTYDGTTKNNLAYLPIPRKQQSGKATLLVLNLVKDSGPISVVDSTGKTVDQLSHIKYGDFRSLYGVNPVKTSLQFVDDKSGKALMQFETYSVEADTIYSILLVGTVDNPVGINVPSSPDTMSITAN